ncbi:hypothetical protein DSM104329_02565 [Capillimicrobium parvum]|uniref:HTH gntR-type domain-containing protein n=1 Tax=Capillimicrobium parvum TaxID=2884022 RepID=A0A9E7C088_9ACTN|nr:hypothetical protein DSM104329_02565 [Capillimicrobium parvum]
MHNPCIAVESRPTRAGQVQDELRRRIRSGDLPPGARLRQDELAARFGVSSTPVREALTALTREGLVRHDAHRGAVVHLPTPDDVRENFEIRLALEPLATSLAAGRLDRRTTAELLVFVEDLDAAVDHAMRTGTTSDYEHADRALHLTIFTVAGRPRLTEMIESLRDAAAAYAHLHRPAGFDEPILRRLHAQHREIVAALRAGDAAQAGLLAAAHVWLTADGAAVEPDPRLPRVEPA